MDLANTQVMAALNTRTIKAGAASALLPPRKNCIAVTAFGLNIQTMPQYAIRTNHGATAISVSIFNEALPTEIRQQFSIKRWGKLSPKDI